MKHNEPMADSKGTKTYKVIKTLQVQKRSPKDIAA
jgi:hypothetical protein